MEQQLIKTILNNATYLENQANLRRSLFSDDFAAIYDLVKEAHGKYEHDITPDEVYSLWLSQNPVATSAEIHEVRDVVDQIKHAEAISSDIASDVINNLWRKDIGREVANLGINMSEGDPSALRRLQTLLERISDSYMPDDFGEDITDDIYELLAEVSDDNKFAFNISTLSRHLYGLGGGDFAIVAARPETGKSAFMVSICAAPGGFCSQGAKVLYLGNEEKSMRTKLRAVQACSNMTREQIAQKPDLANSVYMSIRDKLIFKDTQDWDLDKINAYCERVKCDILIIDQADKVHIAGNYNSSHERIRELYRSLREVAKRHNCAVIAVSQASADAEGKTRIDFSMLEGSKTGKAAEADVIIGIGKAAGGGDDEQNTERCLYISKNKLSGFHGAIYCKIEPEVSRYAE